MASVGILRAVRFVGQSGKDTYYGTLEDDWITGGSGDDFLLGGGGSDLIDGGSDSDQLGGDAGDDLLFGGSGNDIQYGGTGDDQLDGGSGNDIANGGSGNDTLFGRSEADLLDGGAGDDIVYGGTGDDTLLWRGAENAGARDTIFGGDGNDLLQLDLTAAQWASTAFQAEYAAFLTWIAGPAGSAGESGPRFVFSTLGGLTIAGTNRVEVTVDGGPAVPIDQPVVTRDDPVSVSEDGPTFNGNVLANDTVGDGVGGIALLGDTTQGTLVFNPDGSFAYTPGSALQTLAAGQTATDSFSYRVIDIDGDSGIATVSITITGANDAPIAAAISGAVGEDGATQLAPSFSDIDAGNTHAISIDSSAARGLVIVNADGTIRYDATGRFDSLAVGQTATDSFTYTVTDSSGGTSTATATVTVTGANDAPTVRGVAGGTSEDGPAITLAPAFSDPDSVDSHTTSVNLAGTRGAVSVNGDGSLRYDASGRFDSLAAGETAIDSFTYTMTDALGAAASATAVITVTGQNDGPTVGTADLAGLVTRRPDGAPDSGSATHNAGGTIAFGDLDLSDSHILSVTPLAGGYRGDFAATITQDSTGGAAGAIAWGFTVNDGALADLQPGQPLAQDYAVTIDDGHGGTVTRTVTITLQGGNAPPDAFDMAVTVDEDGPPATGAPFFFDPDAGDTFTVSVNTSGTRGVVTVNADGTFTYDPAGRFENLAAGATAIDTFRFTVTDSAGGSSTATAEVTVVGQNDGPVAQMIRGDADEEGGTALPPVFRDPDAGDSHTITVDLTGTRGTVWIRPDGEIGYEAKHKFNDLAAGQTFVDTFTYTVTDGQGASSTSTATMTITGANDAPVLAPMFGTIAANGTLQLTADFSDPDIADNHAFGIDASGALGQVAMTGGFGMRYDPAGRFDHLLAGQTATDKFRYAITDSDGTVYFQDVLVTIEGRNDAPDVFDMAVTVDEDGPAATGAPFFVDSDPGDTFSVSVDTAGTRGAVVVNADGTFTYDPTGRFENLAAGATAIDIFRFTVTDSAGGSSTATAEVTVVGQNDGPVAQMIRGDADEEGGTALPPVFRDPDSGDSHTITVDLTGTRGTVWIRPDGEIGYEAKHKFNDLAAGQTAIDTFTYTVTDGQGASSTSTATMTITGANDLPILAPMFGTVGTNGTLQLTADFFDPDIGENHDLGIDASGALGVVTLTGGLGMQYDPAGRFSHLLIGETATDSFRYAITDSSGITFFQDVFITIEGRNDAPQTFDMAVTVDEDGPPATGAPFFSDSDPGDTFTVSVDTAGTRGAVVVNADGTFTYDPAGRFENLAAGATAIDIFRFTVTDSAGGSSTATAEVTVVGQNDDPVAQLIRGDADEEGGTYLPPVFRDADSGDTHTITVDLTGTRGTVWIRDNGEIGYEAKHRFDDLAAGQTYADTFTYTVTDSQGASSTSTATMTITGANDAPVALDIQGDVDEDGPGVTLLPLFVDPDAGDVFAIDVDTSGTLGLVTINPDGTLQYDPNGQFEALDSGQAATDLFTYTIVDSQGARSTASVRITISGAADTPPVALFSDGGDSVDFSGVLASRYIAGTQYDALDGNDVIVLPSTASLAARSGFASGTPFHGGQGDDLIVANSDAVDIILGDDGNDTIDAVDGGGADQLFGGLGDDVVASGGQSATLYGGDGFDQLNGRDGATLYGEAGDDVIETVAATGYGGLGNDIMIGNGSSRLFGDDGADLMFGVVGDVVLGGEGDDELLGSAGASLMGGSGNDLLIVIDGAHAAGGDGADMLYGGSGTTILGERGDDTLFVVSSSQIAIGGEGTDTAIFTDARDVIGELGGIDVERIEMADGDDVFDVGSSAGTVGVNVHGGTGDDTLAGRGGNDTLSGGIGDDAVMGGDGNDTLFGGDGDDRIQGGAGNDILSGGANADIFEITSGGGHDTISGFQNGIDMIDASALGIGLGSIGAINVSGGALVWFGIGGPSVLLSGVSAGSLDAGDFLL